MKITNSSEFTMKYTGRAFEQDAGQAMKSDIIRALIELLTNGDDAYGRAGSVGKIDIVIKRPAEPGESVEVTVRDRATGLAPELMKGCFGVMGDDMSGFSTGAKVRGFFSRGAKDTCVFGETRFESIKDGVFSQVTIRPDLSGSFSTEPATTKHLSKLDLSIGQNGLSATVFVKGGKYKVPELRILSERLCTHVQLRQLVERQNVTVSEIRANKLFQEVRIVWDPPKSSKIGTYELPILGYDCVARLVLNKFDQRIDGPVNEYSYHGVEIRGTRAVYENTMFGLTGSATGWISGSVSCEKIDDLIREFMSDDEGDLKNNKLLVTRSRDGLERDHPFMRALTVAVVEILKPILDELEPKATESGSEKFRKQLDRFSELLAEELKSDLDEDFEGGEGELPTPLKPIIVIPPRIIAGIGVRRTLTALVHAKSVAANGLVARSGSACLELLADPTKFINHPRYADILVSQIRIETLIEGSGILVIAAADDARMTGTSTIIVRETVSEEEPPIDFEWKNKQMSVATGKSRSLLLRAPIELAPAGEFEANVELNGDTVRLNQSKVILKLNSKGWLEGRVKVTGIKHGADSCRVAALNGTTVAVGTIRTTLPSPTTGLNLQTKIVDEHRGAIRGEMTAEADGLLLKMFGRHPGLARHLGRYNKSDGAYSREDAPETQAVVAEVMSSVASDYIVRKQAERDPGEYKDIEATLYNRTKFVDRYLRILMEGLRASKSE